MLVSKRLWALVIDGLCGGPFTPRCLLIGLNDLTPLMSSMDKNGAAGEGTKL